MQYCPKCRINIRGDKKHCPLCHGDLTGEPVSGPFPVLKKRFSKVSVLKVVTFIAAAVIIAMLVTGFIIDKHWPLGAIVIAIVSWADIVIALYYRNNIIRLVTTEIYIGMVICLLIDMRFKFYGWSISWVIPFSFIGLIVFTILASIFTKRRLRDCIIYYFFHAIVSLLQLIPVFTKVNKLPLPALITTAVLVLFAIALFIFRFKDLKNASEKWFNV